MHLCLFYTQPEELWAQCQNQIADASPTARWLYVADEHSAELVHHQLIDAHISGEVLDSIGTSFRASQIRIPALIFALTQRIEAQLLNCTHVLLFVEMSWAIRTPSGAVYLREYEAEIERLTEQLPLTVVCLYNQKIMLDRQLMLGMHAHRHLLVSDGVVSNPHFVPPEIFANRSLRGQFEHWLNELSPTADSEKSVVAPLPKSYHFETEAKLIAQPSEEGRWKIRCFGGLRVYRSDGALVQWNVVSGATRKTKALFAFLLFRGERGATVEEISDLLWPDADELKQSINRLHHTIRCLRKALSPDLIDSKKSPFVLREDQRYFLALPPNSWLDLPMFQELCYRGQMLIRQQNWDEALVCQQSAERLYTGDLLADIPDKYAANRDIDWCWSQRYWYRDMYVKLLVNSAEVYRQTQRISEALTSCDKALQHDPISEMAHQEKMCILAAVNRRDALLRQYRMYKDALKQFDMGVPSSEFEQFFMSLNVEGVNQIKAQ
ncbi:MAG: BTAD domain-containing putative transcriptional regulator [Anaerolineae bacterium]